MPSLAKGCYLYQEYIIVCRAYSLDIMYCLRFLNFKHKQRLILKNNVLAKKLHNCQQILKSQIILF
jgi:hypothetical protein